MKALRAYYQLQRLSLCRYWRSLPILFRIFGIIFLLLVTYGLYKINIQPDDWKLTVAIVAIFGYLSFQFSLNKPHQLFLHNYNISTHLVLLIKITLLTIPFFILSWEIGCLCSIIAVLIALSKPNKISVKNKISRFKPRYFFRKESFQWHSFYRQMGFYIHILGIIGICMGIIHNNTNLSLVAFSLIGVVLGIGSTLSMEPLFFIKTYPNPRQLIQKKSVEIIYNISVLQLPLVILLPFFGVSLKDLLYFFFSTITLSWITLAIKYNRYPNGGLAQLLLFFAVLPWVILSLAIGSWMLISIFLIGGLAGYFMWSNLQKIFYHPQTSEL